jgi:leucyl aminopeptidase
MIIKNVKATQKIENTIYLINRKSDFSKLGLLKEESSYLRSQISKEATQIILNRYSKLIIFILPKESEHKQQYVENARKEGFKINSLLNLQKVTEVLIIDTINNGDLTVGLIEGIALTNYQFLKYQNDASTKKNTLTKIFVSSKKVNDIKTDALQCVIKGVYKARDLVNEPPNFLTATQLSKEIEAMGLDSGFTTKVFNKEKITELKMGGLLAVNRGSVEPPTFNILEYKNKKAKNTIPYVIVGKGIVYDTGGLSLKPTEGMDTMKADMGGAAAVAGAIYAIAKSNLPIHIIGLIPSTDNRPGGDAYTNGDVIKMYSGLTVEILNTDAEGRIVLADALAYAKQFKPALVVDIATLTGAASAAVGKEAVVAMGNAPKEQMDLLKESGFNVFERIVEFPFWDDYSEYLKSDIADMKNIGGKTAGAITAGKFLERFTDYPYIHIDIAGSAFLQTLDSYRGKGATGVGVRLLYDFFHEKV